MTFTLFIAVLTVGTFLAAAPIIFQPQIRQMLAARNQPHE